MQSRPLMAGSTRNIGTVPAQINGPAERACGSCHRAAFIYSDDPSSLAAFYAHTSVNGTSVADTTAASLEAVDAYLMGLVGASAPTAVVAGANIEACVVCHKNAGDFHQKLFDSWKNGL